MAVTGSGQQGRPDRRGPADAFVGRERELASLERGLERAIDGQPGVALVVGEAGIGKSRLVDVLARTARQRGLRVIWGQATERQTAPLSLWVGVERALADRPDAAADPAGTLPPSERRWALLDGIGAGLSEAAPLLLVLEDLHWADDSSLWVLEQLPRQLLDQPLMIAATARSEESDQAALAGVRKQAEVIELAGLDAEAVNRLVAVLRPEQAEPTDDAGSTEGAGLLRRAAPAEPARSARWADAEDLVSRTGGNPLFLRELLALGTDGRLPPVVSDVLQRSLERLDEPVRRALATLAVAGPDTPLAVLTAALGTTVDDVMARFEAAAAADVVRLGPAGRAEFRHVLLSEAAAAAVSPAERRSRHTALADSWQILGTSPTGQGRAAWHRLAALPEGDPAVAASTTLAAVDALQAAGDEVAAAELAEAASRALAACGPDQLVEERGQIELQLAQALHALGEELPGQQTFERAADLLRSSDDPERRALAETGACRRANPFVPHPERVQRLAEVEAALPSGDHPLRVSLLGRLSVLRASTPDELPEAHADGDAAVAMARRLGDPDLLVTALADRYFIPGGVAGLEARAAAADEIIALGTRLRRPDISLQGYEWQYTDRLDRGDRHGANASLEALEAYAQVMPSPRWRWAAYVRRAAIQQLDGDLDGVLARVDQLEEQGRELADQMETLGFEHSIRTTTVLLWGRPDPALPPVHTRIEAMAAAFTGAPFIHIMNARGYYAIGQPEQARAAVVRYAADPEPLLRLLEGPHLLAIVADLAASLGVVEHAGRLRRALGPFRQRLASGSGIQPIVPAATTLARLALLEGDVEAAVTHGREGLALAAAMPSPTLVAHSAAALSEAQRAAGDLAGAAESLAQARRAAEAVGVRLPDDATTDTAGAGAGAEAERVRRTPLTTELATVPDPEHPAPPSPTHESPQAARPRAGALRRRRGHGWDIESPHGQASLADSLGVAQLARLLAQPGREVAATELAGMDAAAVPVARDLGAALDARAKREYRRRIGELQDDIDEAESHHDPERAAQARIELDALVGELRRAVGLDGRDRPHGSGAERARVNVTRSLKRAVAAIGDQVPDLGAHLERSLRTGRFCSYSPEPATALTWEIADTDS